MRFIVNDVDLSKVRYTRKFGQMVHPVTGKVNFHNGIDLGMPVGTKLIAPSNGVVYLNKTNGGGVNSGYGHYLVIQLDNGYYMLFGHLKERSSLSVGTKFKAGDVIATSGNTGTSTGPHLHLETHKSRFKFRSEKDGTKYVVNPVKVYSDLVNYYGRSLKGMGVKSMTEQDVKRIVKEVLSEKENDLKVYAQEGKDFVVQNNISDGSFPGRYVTRQEVWTMLQRMFKNLLS